nr:unnamed protein product [Callosobruchus chinensis]
MVNCITGYRKPGGI